MRFLKDDEIRKKLFVGTLLITFFFICRNISFIWGSILKLLEMLSPFLVGAAIAFILNVPMRWIEGFILKDREKYKGKWNGLRRAISLVITLLLAVLIITLLLYMIIPQLTLTISVMIKQVPSGVKRVTEWGNTQFKNEPILQEIIQNFSEDWQSILQQSFGMLKKTLNSMLEGGINAAVGIVSGVFNFIIGFIFALYILVQKEKLGTQASMICYAVFKEKIADEITEVMRLASKTFASFISGQCTEALILASMFSLSMTIMRLPYALLIGLLIGATSLIPVAGTFIGCAIGALLIVFVDPMKALAFLILFIVLQQIEGNLIYPKVVGDSVGLPGIWVLLAVTVGGSMFGVVGIVTFIPICSVAYSLFRRYIKLRLTNKNIEDRFDYELKFKQPHETVGKTLVRKLRIKDRAEDSTETKAEDNTEKSTENNIDKTKE